MKSRLFIIEVLKKKLKFESILLFLNYWKLARVPGYQDGVRCRSKKKKEEG